MIFLEDLPLNCPPPSAVTASIEGAYRIVSSSTPTIDDFKSHMELNIPVFPGTPECRARSCSLFMDRSKAIEIANLPKSRFAKPHLALVQIGPSDGYSKTNLKGHVDLWVSKDFDPSVSVVDVEPAYVDAEVKGP